MFAGVFFSDELDNVALSDIMNTLQGMGMIRFRGMLQYMYLILGVGIAGRYGRFLCLLLWLIRHAHLSCYKGRLHLRPAQEAADWSQGLFNVYDKRCISSWQSAIVLRMLR